MSNQIEASVDQAIKYIRDKLINDKLIMADATETLGWSFPRIRSRAHTICKKLNGTFTKVERGVYILQPNETITSDASIEAGKESNVN